MSNTDRVSSRWFRTPHGTMSEEDMPEYVRERLVVEYHIERLERRVGL